MSDPITSFMDIVNQDIKSFEPYPHIEPSGTEESVDSIDIAGGRWFRGLSVKQFASVSDIGDSDNPYIVATWSTGLITAESSAPVFYDFDKILLVELVYAVYAVESAEYPDNPPFDGDLVITNWKQYQFGDIRDNIMTDTERENRATIERNPESGDHFGELQLYNVDTVVAASKSVPFFVSSSSTPVGGELAWLPVDSNQGSSPPQFSLELLDPYFFQIYGFRDHARTEDVHAESVGANYDLLARKVDSQSVTYIAMDTFVPNVANSANEPTEEWDWTLHDIATDHGDSPEAPPGGDGDILVWDTFTSRFIWGTGDDLTIFHHHLDFTADVSPADSGAVNTDHDYRYPVQGNAFNSLTGKVCFQNIGYGSSTNPAGMLRITLSPNAASELSNAEGNIWQVNDDSVFKILNTTPGAFQEGALQVMGGAYFELESFFQSHVLLASTDTADDDDEGALQLQGGFSFKGASCGKAGTSTVWLLNGSGGKFWDDEFHVNLADDSDGYSLFADDGQNQAYLCDGTYAVNANVGPINANAMSGYQIGGIQGQTLANWYKGGIIVGTDIVEKSIRVIPAGGGDPIEMRVLARPI